MDTAYNLVKAFIDPVCFVLILIGIGVLVSLKREKNRFEKSLFIFIFLFLYLTSISPISNGLAHFLEKDYLLHRDSTIERLDIIVILGGGISENKYLKESMSSGQTASRLLHAIKVFNESSAKYLVCAGKGTGKISEAEVMGIAAERMGIPKERIKLDAESQNTNEHAENISKMFGDKNIRVGLVTSAYHMKRSETEFRKYFSNVFPFPSDYLYSSSKKSSLLTFLPRTGHLYKSYTAMHEIIGLIWYQLRYKS